MIVQAIAKTTNGINLTEAEMNDVMTEIADEVATPSQIGAFLTALSMKGETVEELTAAAKVMRQKVLPVKLSLTEDISLIDIVGTGGDKRGTFNISTIAAFVIAGSGVRVAKHGNRSVSSNCGSADLMEALGVNIEISVETVKKCIEEVGLGFLYAPLFHVTMKHVAKIRKELAIRTIFNLLGPLTNPAMVSALFIGVYNTSLTDLFAKVLRNLGCTHALIVNGSDGIDEITITGETMVTELKGENILTYSIHPSDFGMNTGTLKDLRGNSVKENADIARAILRGEKGKKRDIILLNSAAGLKVAGKVDSFNQGIEMAADSIDSGRAMKVLDQLIEVTGGS